MAGYLIGLGFPFEVLHPPELGLWLCTLGRRLIGTYSELLVGEQLGTVGGPSMPGSDNRHH